MTGAQRETIERYHSMPGVSSKRIGRVFAGVHLRGDAGKVVWASCPCWRDPREPMDGTPMPRPTGYLPPEDRPPPTLRAARSAGLDRFRRLGDPAKFAAARVRVTSSEAQPQTVSRWGAIGNQRCPSRVAASASLVRSAARTPSLSRGADQSNLRSEKEEFRTV